MPRKTVRKAPIRPVEPSNTPEAPPVTPLAPKPPTGPLTGAEFDALWLAMSPRHRERVRARAEEFQMTLRGVLNQWPQLREG